MRRLPIIISVLVLFGILFFIFIPKETPTPTYRTDGYITIASTTIPVEIAKTESARVQGLSGRTEPKEDFGMLFIFEKSDIQGFWMKDMRFPIDIGWFDDRKHLIFIVGGADPASFPKIYAPQTPARYVLEVPSGFFEQHHVKIGDSMVIPLSI